uniref:Transcriptional cofactor Bfc domain-containing protein n=1 Tax=Glossina palpalis gambiensis TaxID=67801 RepID=A0A1B0AL21_9MUSC
MAQNFLYMFEVVVDDLLVTRPNYCAPEEYPTCCEVSFRNSVFLSICDRGFGECVDPTAPKCGKCCLFSLDAPINDTDKLLIHIYKKKTNKCKFLVGCTDMPIKGLFDKVMESFNIENPKWEDTAKKHITSISNPHEPKSSEIIDNDCDEDSMGRREQLCPTSELTKRLLPLFNLKGSQTGNVVLIIRLVANGPAIVSSFPFARICQAGCGAKPPNCSPKQCPKSCPDSATNKCNGADDILPNIGRCCGGMDSAFGASGTSKTAATSSAKESSKDDKCDAPSSSTATYGNKSACGGRKVYKNHKDPCNGCPALEDPCKKEEKKLRCMRYFACNADKGCPCDNVEDDCERDKQKQQACKPPKCNCPDSKKKSSSGSKDKDYNKSQACSCDECMDECEAGKSLLVAFLFAKMKKTTTWIVPFSRVQIISEIFSIICKMIYRSTCYLFVCTQYFY